MSLTPIAGAAASIQSAIALASQKTGIDFSYLLGQAQLESGLNASARANTSSATGLYQFVEQSWLGVVKAHGSEYGLGWAADSITKNASGRYTVSDSATKQAILSLRKDPQVSSMMAAEYASDNKDALEGALGRSTNGTDLYVAHFLGLGGAKSFLKSLANNPDQSGASLFPAAARANRSVFYTSGGQPRSLADIYSRFADKLEQGADGASSATSFGGATMSSATYLTADGSTVIPGSGEGGADAVTWAQSTIDRLQSGTSTASLLRPTPGTARLAYLMLASMGG